MITTVVFSGAHVIVTSRPHTLTYLQSSKWFNTLAKKSMSLDIQGLSGQLYL
jgi:hypothetical protein